MLRRCISATPPGRKKQEPSGPLPEFMQVRAPVRIWHQPVRQHSEIARVQPILSPSNPDPWTAFGLVARKDIPLDTVIIPYYTLRGTIWAATDEGQYDPAVPQDYMMVGPFYRDRRLRNPTVDGMFEMGGKANHSEHPNAAFVEASEVWGDTARGMVIVACEFIPKGCEIRVHYGRAFAAQMMKKSMPEGFRYDVEYYSPLYKSIIYIEEEPPKPKEWDSLLWEQRPDGSYVIKEGPAPSSGSVSDALMYLGLSMYANAFVEADYDDLYYLQRCCTVAERADIAQDVGMEPLHARRFVEHGL